MADAITTQEALAKAIEHALDNPVDHEFAIDLEGNIYRGRYTKSTSVPPNKREKIPAPPKWGVIQLDRREGEEASSSGQ